MMRPPPWRFMWGMASRDMRAKNSKDRCSAVAHCSSVALRARARGGPPELSKRMSRRPNRLVAAAIRSRIVWWLSRSPATARTSLPVASRISFAVRSRSAWVRLHTTTLAPSSASTSAQARPRPLLAPPTTATLSLSSRSMGDAPFSRPARVSGTCTVAERARYWSGGHDLSRPDAPARTLTAQQHDALTVARGGYGLGGRRNVAMSHVQTKPITNWCPQAKPNEQGQCGTDKIAEDGKRHHCDKTPGHAADLHSCKCGMQWKHMM